MWTKASCRRCGSCRYFFSNTPHCSTGHVRRQYASMSAFVSAGIPRPQPRRRQRLTKSNFRKFSCLTCRKKKVKCSGTSPCLYCKKRGLECTISDQGKRRVYSVMRIQDLETRLASYEKAVQPRREDHLSAPEAGSSSAKNSPELAHLGNIIPAESFDLPRATRSTPGGRTNTEPSEPSPGSAIAADSSLSSSYTFGSRVRTLLENPRTTQRQDNIRFMPTKDIPRSLHKKIDIFDLPSLPTREEAFSLLETHVFYVGYTQNHVDARGISDKIGLLYSNPPCTGGKDNLWTLEILLIFAIARLFKGDFGGCTDGADSFPGYPLFDFVCERIPSLTQLYSVGTVGVEVLALVAVYLQNINRKEEAYVYISTALRLAVSHGFHRSSSTKHLLQSEATHINRLWWSVYLQERRLAAATGNPSGISDAVIEQALPTDSIGFTPAGPMRTSIKLARVYGQIITVLYGSKLQAEDTFVSNVQDIVRSLYDISDEVPADLATGLPRLGHDLSLRTSAALHLMFYQALLLTIRPIMLHIAQLILSDKPPSPEILYSSSLGKLSRTCTEAARRLLKVLMTLRQKNFIALFGFFDFDGIFSVSFIMILTAIFDSACHADQRIDPSPGLGEALKIMQYVASHKNKFAAQWLQEIEKTWDQLCSRLNMSHPSKPPTRLPSPEAREGSNGNTLREASTMLRMDCPNESAEAMALDEERAVAREEPGFGLDTSLGVGEQDPQSILSDLDIWEGINQFWGPLPENYEESQNGDNPEASHGFYQGLYGNPYWTFTGEDMGDFAELGRHIENYYSA